MEDVPDRDLVALAREGDAEAFRVLVERHEMRLRARLRDRLDPVLRRRVSVADLLQETHVAAFRSLASFEDRGEGAFGAWLAGIAEHKVHEALRRHRYACRDVGREQSAPGSAAPPEAEGKEPSPSQVATETERSDRVRQALEGLPPDYRLVLTLVQSDGMRLADAAQILGRSYEAVKKLYGRALDRFAALLGEAGGDA